MTEGGRVTIYDEMRGYVHAHDWNGWFDVETETGPMNQMIQQAEAEADKLREELEAEHALAETLGHYHEDAKAENAKLRELVLCLLTCASDVIDCDKCPINGGPGVWDFEDFCDGLLDRVHEMRIEVSDGR